MSVHPSFLGEFTDQHGPEPRRLLVRPPQRILAVLASSITLLLLLFPAGKVDAADSPAWNWAHSLEMGIRKDARAPGYKVTNVLVRPYHPLIIGGRVRVELFQAWIAYIHRGRSYVEYQVITPDGQIMDEAYVDFVGDTGGVVG
jgi:hypothetical protein